MTPITDLCTGAGGGGWGEVTSSSASRCFLATSQPTALSVMVGCMYPGPLSAVSHGGLPHSKIKGTAPAQETDQTKVNLSCRPPSQNWGPGNHTPLVRRQVRQHHCNCLPPQLSATRPAPHAPGAGEELGEDCSLIIKQTGKPAGHAIPVTIKVEIFLDIFIFFF